MRQMVSEGQVQMVSLSLLYVSENVYLCVCADEEPWLEPWLEEWLKEGTVTSHVSQLDHRGGHPSHWQEVGRQGWRYLLQRSFDQLMDELCTKAEKGLQHRASSQNVDAVSPPSPLSLIFDTDVAAIASLQTHVSLGPFLAYWGADGDDDMRILEWTRRRDDIKVGHAATRLTGWIWGWL